MGCGRQFCPGCQEELIHRDHRKGWESASTLGQIVWRDGPKVMGAMDMDLCTERCDKGKHLLRMLEHKQEAAKPLRFSQTHILGLLANILDQAIRCTDPIHADTKLDSRSGLFLIRGPIAGAETGRHKCAFTGPQTVTRLVDQKELAVFDAHKDIRPFMSWIYGNSAWSPRNG